MVVVTCPPQHKQLKFLEHFKVEIYVLFAGQDYSYLNIYRYKREGKNAHTQKLYTHLEFMSILIKKSLI